MLAGLALGGLALLVRTGHVPAADGPPRIAVLRFDNLSPDPGQGFLAEGLAEDLITGLTQLDEIRVLSPHTSFAVDPALPAGEIGRQLGVGYVVSGSVQRAGGRLRISARLVDVAEDRPVWTDRYDGGTGDVFAFQDRIAAAVVDALVVSLTGTARASGATVRTANLAAYDAYLRGMRFIAGRRRFDVAAVDGARAAFAEAIDLDPGYALAYAGLAWVEYISYETVNYYQGAGLAYELAEASMALAENALAHRVLSKRSFNLLFEVDGRRDPAQALAHLEAARQLQPGEPDILADLAAALAFVGRPEEALAAIERAEDLNPAHPDWYFASSGVALLLTGATDRAIRDLETWSSASPSWNVPYLFLAAAYGLAGRDADARAALQRQKDLSGLLSHYAVNRTWPMQARERDLFNRGLRVAGLD